MTHPPGQRRLAASVGAVTLWMGTPLVLAQQFSPPHPPLNQPSGVGPVTFTRIDQTVADVDPLRVSFRYLSTDLRQPTGFRDVYRIEGNQRPLSRYGLPTGAGNDLLARFDGAVTAVFPQSVYVPTREGVVPLIPPGTVFFIGGVPSDFFAQAPESPPPPTHVNLRVDQRGDAPAPAPSGGPSSGTTPTPAPAPAAAPAQRRTDEKVPTVEPTRASRPIMTDEALRRTTVRELIMKAAEASGAHVNPPAPAPVPAREHPPAGAETPRDEKGAAPAKPERPGSVPR